MDTLTLTVEAIAHTGKSFKGSNGNWYKRGKNAKFSDFSALRKGQEVILTTQGEWVSDFTTTGGTNATNTNSNSSNGTNRSNLLNVSSNGDIISRQSAVKSVLGSPVVAELLRGTDVNSTQAMDIVDGLIAKYFTYITTGSFGSIPVTPAEALKEVVNA